jgi:predicted ester cyclase
MTAEQNIAATRRLIEEGFNAGNLSVCDELVAADSVEHQRGSKSGAAGTKETIRTLRSWFSDFQLTIVDLVAHDDTVWFRNRATGVNTGEVLGRPATGRPFDITVIDIVRFVDGKIVEHWGVPDQLGMLLQLGLFGRQEAPAPVAV